MNNKSRIALAIAAAFGTAALGVSSGAIAQTSSVQIGGGLNAKYVQHKNTGGVSTAYKNSNNDHLSLQEPELWIHGEEKIGNETVWFRCSSSFDVTGGEAAGLCTRNSAIGFKGNFGNIYAGNWESANRPIYNAARGWFSGTDSLVGGFANIMLGGSASNKNNVTATEGSFVERMQRTIRYDSPNLGGFNMSASYTAANESTGLSTAASQGLTPRQFSLSGLYNNGPLFVGLAYSQHNDYNPASTANGTSAPVTIGTGATQYNGGHDKNWMFTAGYTFDFGTRLSGFYTTTNFDITNTTNLKKSGWAVFVDHNLGGPHSIKAAYYKAGDSKGSSTTLGAGINPAAGANTGAKGWNLGYMYALSKRSSVGFMYSVIDNDSQAAYGKGINTAGTLGQTQKVYGLHSRHSF